MALGVPRVNVPTVDRDENLLVDKGRGLAGTKTDSRELAVERSGEDGLGSEGGRVERGEGGGIDVANVPEERKDAEGRSANANDSVGGDNQLTVSSSV
jgi:hypothetical protein